MKKFTLTPAENFPEIGQVMEFVDSEAMRLGLSRKETVKIGLMTEETLTKLLEYTDNTKAVTAEVSAKKFMGTVTFTLKIPGREADFMKDIQRQIPPELYDENADTSNAINDALLRSFQDNLRYTHRRGMNCIKILASRSPYTSLIQTVYAIILAVITGLLLKNYASPELCTVLNVNLLAPVRTVMMNGFKMCTIALVFFSLVNSISGFGNLSDMRKLGLKCMSRFFTYQVICAVIAVGVFYLFRPVMLSGFGVLSDMLASENAANPAQRNFVAEMLAHLLPANFLSPFLDNDVLQLLLMGILFGSAIRMTNAATLETLISEFYSVFGKVMHMIVNFVPVMIFCSITGQLLSSGTGSLLQLIWIVAAVFVGYIGVMMFYCMIVMFRCRMNLREFMSAAVPAMLTSASIDSVTASIPTNMEACKKLSVPSEVYSMSVPMAAIFNKNSDCIITITTSLCLALMCGINVPAMRILSLSVYAIIILSSASGFVGLITIPLFLGVPSGAVELLFGISTFIDMVGMFPETFGILASSLEIAKD